MQAEVSDLKDPTTIDDTVGRLEVSVRHNFAIVQKNHSLQITMISEFVSDTGPTAIVNKKLIRR